MLGKYGTRSKYPKGMLDNHLAVDHENRPTCKLLHPRMRACVRILARPSMRASMRINAVLREKSSGYQTKERRKQVLVLDVVV